MLAILASNYVVIYELWEPYLPVEGTYISWNGNEYPLADYWYSWGMSFFHNLEIILWMIFFLKIMPRRPAIWVKTRIPIMIYCWWYIADSLGMMTVNVERYDNFWWEAGALLFAASVYFLYFRKKINQKSAEENSRAEEWIL